MILAALSKCKPSCWRKSREWVRLTAIDCWSPWDKKVEGLHPVRVRKDLVWRITPTEVGSLLMSTDGSSVHVHHTPDELEKLLKP